MVFSALLSLAFFAFYMIAPAVVQVNMCRIFLAIRRRSMEMERITGGPQGEPPGRARGVSKYLDELSYQDLSSKRVLG